MLIKCIINVTLDKRIISVTLVTTVLLSINEIYLEIVTCLILNCSE